MRNVVMFGLAVLVIGIWCVANAPHDDELHQIEKVYPLTMEGIKNPPPEYHHKFRRFEYGNSPQERPQGIIVSKDTSATIQPWSEAVMGFPCLLNFRLRVEGENARSLWVLDVAASADPMTNVDFFVVDADRIAYSFGRGPTDSYHRNSKRPLSVGQERLEPGDELSMWFDLYHLMSGQYVSVQHSELEHGERFGQKPLNLEMLLRPGESRVVMVFDHKTAANETPLILNVRTPTPAEKAFLIEIGRGGGITSWFPELVVSDNSFPPADDLPVESRMPVRLVEILRAAIRSPEYGLDVLYGNVSDEWGLLQDLIDQIEFECLLELGEQQKATSVAGRLEPANEHLIRNGKGVIAAYRMIYSRDLDSP